MKKQLNIKGAVRIYFKTLVTIIIHEHFIHQIWHHSPREIKTKNYRISCESATSKYRSWKSWFFFLLLFRRHCRQMASARKHFKIHHIRLYSYVYMCVCVRVCPSGQLNWICCKTHTHTYRQKSQITHTHACICLSIYVWPLTCLRPINISLRY